MDFFSLLYFRFKKVWKAVRLYLVIAGPGLVVMISDNDAGGITTYAATGAKYGYHLIWFLLLLIPVAYYVQEMTVRLGAGIRCQYYHHGSERRVPGCHDQQ